MGSRDAGLFGVTSLRRSRSPTNNLLNSSLSNPVLRPRPAHLAPRHTDAEQIGRHRPPRTLPLTTPTLGQAVGPRADWHALRPPCRRQPTPSLRALLIPTLSIQAVDVVHPTLETEPVTLPDVVQNFKGPPFARSSVSRRSPRSRRINARARLASRSLLTRKSRRESLRLWTMLCLPSVRHTRANSMRPLLLFSELISHVDQSTDRSSLLRRRDFKFL